MRIIFIFPYPIGEGPSQRFRFEQFYDDLRKREIEYDTQAFFDIKTWRILHKRGNTIYKLLGVFKGFVRRIKLLTTINQYDWVFIHREAAPIGPPIFEWVIARILRKKIIYDFDDAIWLPNVSDSNKFASKLKGYSKVSSICKWAYRVSCGNEYLAAYARLRNNNVIIFPTIVNTDVFKPSKDIHQQPITIGWTGSVSTNKWLEDIESVLQVVQQKTTCRYLFISNEPPRFKNLKYEFLKWNSSSEVSDINQIDIGIMPLPDTEWSKGKCGFKLIQYLSVEKPAVATLVGVNSEIIQEGITGFLCKTDDDWIDRLVYLCTHKDIRTNMGKTGRLHIVKYYSKDSQLDTFMCLFN